MMTWIKLYREFLEWEWFSKPEMVQLFVWMLLKASSTERQWRGITLKRGQFATTYAEMERDTQLSYQTTRTCVARLKSTGEITTESTNKYTLVTICNYERYQDVIFESNQQINQQINEQSTNNQPTTNQRIQDYSPINKNVRINNDINLVLNSARTREGDFIDQLKGEQAWLEVMAKNFGYDVPTIVHLLDKFNTDCQCRAQDHRNITDARQHFNNWLMKHKQNEAENDKRRKATKKVNEIWN